MVSLKVGCDLFRLCVAWSFILASKFQPLLLCDAKYTSHSNIMISLISNSILFALKSHFKS